MFLDVKSMNKTPPYLPPLLGVAGTTVYLKVPYSLDLFNSGFRSILHEKEKDGNRLGQSMEMVP